MSTNISSLIDLVNVPSLADLKRLSEEWNQETIERKQAITTATESYNQALAVARFIDSMIKVREAVRSSENGHKPASSPSQELSASVLPSASINALPSPSSTVEGDEELDKTAKMLDTLRRSRLSPAELYHALLAEGMEVRRAYVYTVLQRLKKREQVDTDENGRYFAV